MRITLIFAIFSFVASLALAEEWRGLKIAPEDRCSPYNRSEQYPYSQSLEDALTAQMGGLIYSPYTGRVFASDTETDIEHIVATSEAHDSGLCAATSEVRRAFASDLLNLTMASPQVNRYEKSGKDASEWLPELNRCWFANRILQVRLKYGLTIDRAEANALESILSSCESTEMIVLIRPSQPPELEGAKTSSSSDPLSLYDDNGNGRITCAEARSHGIAPVPRSHPAYRFMRDGDGDGVVCE